MDTRYQLIFLGDFNSFEQRIQELFSRRILDLGLKISCYRILNEITFHGEYKPNSPTVVVYFGNGGHRNLDLLDVLMADACFVLPVVSNIEHFIGLTPSVLHPINGFELRDFIDAEGLVARILEGLSLLRSSRRLFISYRRVESRSVAIQLYEHLDSCGFDVFLDTHSLLPGDVFQDELWHRLVDTDVAILLDTPGFLGSEWTEMELAKASAMSIGILQLIWPNHDRQPFSTLCYPLYLELTDFDGEKSTGLSSNFTSVALDDIYSNVEGMRARNLAARQDNLIQEFMTSAKRFALNVNLQPEKIITLTEESGDELAIIPTVGVPQSFTYNQAEDLIKRITLNNIKRIFLLYDHRNIVQKWQRHLVWLNLNLKIEAIKITEIETWMSEI